MSFFAYADRRGVISFGHRVPVGSMHVVDDPSEPALRAAVTAHARHAYDGQTLLVPGVPEADTDDAALEALMTFRTRMSQVLAVEAKA